MAERPTSTSRPRRVPSSGLLTLALSALVVSGCAHQVTRPEEPTTHVPSKAHHAWFAEGLASYYGPGLWGNKTASGGRLHKTDLIAAHRTLAFGTCLVVQNLQNGRSVRVKVQDRGPYVKTRLIDVSMAAGRALGMLDKGLARVRLFFCGHEPVDLRSSRR